ncbi:T-cell surface antigen CD2-like isoform X2 [Solea senegalensis]|uniref:T-cell surface antigen CD2-like isoform X2 n=1 Tax=Solea senegalensis TaxID=28829 RepID=A0AAV6SLT6_SOLSE|nr:uncharacterized protein LOC122778438 isoform X3 [Solea senegalensis]KAG7517287.1 T-cell surface antigen CD2-like isoform X2 [Solea senegalensis]
MEAVITLLLMLLGVSYSVETHCDGRQDGAQCYGAVGGTVFIRLMDTIPPRFTFQKNKTRILRWKNKALSIEVMKNQLSFDPSNGILRINNLQKSDSDKYSLEIQDSDAVVVENRTLNLSIQAPFSSVTLVNDCLSQGEMRMSCTTEGGGDSPQYSWTLDGHTLTQDELLSGNKDTDIIVLRQNVSGLLVCSVSNHVSSISKDMRIPTCVFINCTLSNGTHVSQWVFAATNTLCVEPTTVTDTTAEYLPVMAGVLSALVLLLVLGVSVICVQKKKKKSAKEEEDEQELTYSDVRVVQRRHIQQRDEGEVEYGQVRISERPQRAVERSTDDCVYAEVVVKNQ